jgi:hypothetical protein
MASPYQMNWLKKSVMKCSSAGPRDHNAPCFMCEPDHTRILHFEIAKIGVFEQKESKKLRSLMRR